MAPRVEIKLNCFVVLWLVVSYIGFNLHPPYTNQIHHCCTKFHKCNFSSPVQYLVTFSIPFNFCFRLETHLLFQHEFFSFFVKSVLCLAIRLFNLIESQTWWIKISFYNEDSKVPIMISKLKNERGNFSILLWDFNRSSLELKATNELH